DLHGQPLRSGIEAGPLRHRPALHDTVELEAQVEVQAGRSVLLDHKTKMSLRTAGRLRGVGGRRIARLGRHAEVALATVLGQRSARLLVRPGLLLLPLRSHGTSAACWSQEARTCRSLSPGGQTRSCRSTPPRANISGSSPSSYRRYAHDATAGSSSG